MNIHKIIFTLILLFGVHLFSNGQSAYVGETISLDPPSVSGTLDAAGWYSNSDNVSVSGNTSGANVTINSYFSGSVTITCQYAYRTFSGKKSKGNSTYQISCKPSQITLNKTDVTLSVGEQFDLSYTNSSGFKLLFAQWKTSDFNIATVDGMKEAYGHQSVTIKAVKSGECTITCNGLCGGKEVICKVTVKEIPATSIKLTPETLTIVENHSESFKYTITPSNATPDITWTSSNEDIAKVSSSGKVTGIKEGTAIITATTKSGKEATGKVEVLPLPKSISLDNSFRLAEGFSKKLDVQVSPLNAKSEYTWTSSDESIATIDGNGLIKARKTGQCQITVKTENGLSASCRIDVYIPEKGLDAKNATLRLTKLNTLINKTLDHIK